MTDPRPDLAEPAAPPDRLPLADRFALSLAFGGVIGVRLSRDEAQEILRAMRAEAQLRRMVDDMAAQIARDKRARHLELATVWAAFAVALLVIWAVTG